MDLITAINQHAKQAAEAGDFAAVASTLNSLTITIRDPTPVTYADLTRDLGESARQLVAGTVRAIAKSDSPLAGEMADAHTVLLNEQGGLTLHTDERQAMLDTVAGVGKWPEQLTAAIKARGVRTEQLVGRVVTAEQCKNEWQAHQTAVADAVKTVSVTLSANRSKDGSLTVFARSTLTADVGGVTIATINSIQKINNAELIKFLQPIVDKLIDEVTNG